MIGCISHLAARFSGEDADLMLLTASHQTGFDTRSMTRRSVYSGG